jgi:8-hydroxy-5-deazaflavin:NADPH oxidoreductase
MTAISIIGLGNMAQALAGRALAGGNTVEIIGRSQAKAEEVAARLDGATVGTAPTGDIVIIAVPYGSTAAVVSEYGDALKGRIIIDITNPVTPDFQGFVTSEGSSGAEEIAKAAPADAYVFKAFNTLFSHVLTAGGALDVYLAGDDSRAKVRVSEFIKSMGLHPLDIGPLAMARTLENVALMQLGLVAHSLKHTNFSLSVSLLG